MTVELLRYANREAVAQALTESGYSVTRQTVNRWARGDEMPGIARRMILALFGHEPDAHREAAPRWAGRLVANVEAIAQKAGVTDVDRQEAERLAAAEMQGEAPLPQSDDGARAG
jgi:hypothetical protein